MYKYTSISICVSDNNPLGFCGIGCHWLMKDGSEYKCKLFDKALTVLSNSPMRYQGCKDGEDRVNG